MTVVASDLSIRYANAHFAQMAGLDAAPGGWPSLDSFLADADDRLFVRTPWPKGTGLHAASSAWKWVAGGSFGR